MEELRYKEKGIIKAVSGCIAQVTDLQNCFLGQLVNFGYGTQGVIMGCDLNVTQVLMIKESEPLVPGAQAVATLEPFNMPVGPNTVGRILNPLATE